MAKLILPGAGPKTSVSDLLEKAFTTEEVGGPSGFGWHATATYMSCNRKAFFQIAQGLRKRTLGKTSDALNFGTLMHACLALGYRDETRAMEPVEVIRNEYPELAEEAELTLRKLKGRYGRLDNETWDTRGTEVEGRYDFEGRPSFSDSILVPAFFTCRYDLVVGVKEANEPRKALGERCDIARVVDHKFHARLFWDLLPGYRWDPQFVGQTLIWREAKLADLHGELAGVTLNIFIRERKHKDPMQRLPLYFDKDTVDNFQRTVEPEILDCHAKLLYHRDDIRMWSQNFTACNGKYGLCPFYDLCESNGRQIHMYEKKSALKTDALPNSDDDSK